MTHTDLAAKAHRWNPPGFPDVPLYTVLVLFFIGRRDRPEAYLLPPDALTNDEMDLLSRPAPGLDRVRKILGRFPDRRLDWPINVVVPHATMLLCFEPAH